MDRARDAVNQFGMIGRRDLEMHSTKHILTGLSVEGLPEIVFQSSLFESAVLESLDEETPVVAKVRKLQDKTTGKPALSEANVTGWSDREILP